MEAYKTKEGSIKKEPIDLRVEALLQTGELDEETCEILKTLQVTRTGLRGEKRGYEKNESERYTMTNHFLISEGEDRAVSERYQGVKIRLAETNLQLQLICDWVSM